MKLLSSDTIRRCFVADRGMAIFSADFDQVELRVAAGLAQEKPLIEAAKRGESLHKIAALKLWGADYTPDQYRYTKNVNFGWLFGGGAKTLSEQAGISFAEAQAIIRQYEQEFPALTAYKKRTTEQALLTALSTREYKAFRALRSKMFNYRGDTREGLAGRRAVSLEISRLCYRKTGFVITPFGRRLLVDAEKAYSATNYIVQSSAADIMKGALLRVMADPELEPTVLLPIHDELLGQAAISKATRIAERYGEVMSTTFEGVPITASGKVYGKSWGHGYRT